jgi:chromosome segregation ATPase
MWTGRQTLSSIETALASLHGEESQLDQALRSAVAQAERARKERREALKELARVKLDELAAGRLVSNLDAAERRALQILEGYKHRIAAVTERREALLKEVADTQAERHTAAKLVEKALEVLEALRAEIEVKVQSTPEWRAGKATLDAADAVASEAEKKAATSEAELGARKKPYDDDALFSYLWQRKFGTLSYQAGFLARRLDRAVAEYIRYDDARPNYAALIEIPLRLREHATAKRADAVERKTALADLERRAMLEAHVDAKEQVLAEARRKLAITDDAVEKKRAVLEEVDKERGTLMQAGNDPAYDEALQTIAAGDSKDDLETLYAEARRTSSTADDAIVRKVESIDRGIAAADAEIAGLRRSAQDLAKRRLEMEEVRSRFRHAGYDHPHATFGNDRNISDVLGSVLEGAVRSGALWDLLRQGYGNRLPRGRPDFGSAGSSFPFPIPGGGDLGSSGGDWRLPDSRGGWSPSIDRPSPGRSDRDDDRFSTGGSF